MAKLFNRAKMTTSTTGTGTITLGSASNGFQSFADAGVANGDVVQYVIEEGSNFEIGTGTYTSSGTTLTRSPTESSNSDAAITLAGQATVSITAVAADMNRLQHNGSDKVTVSSTGASVTGNISVTGTVDGRDLATDGSKLDGIASSANNYSLPLSSSSTRGGVKIGYAENGKNYPVELSSEKMFVNVPWTDTTPNNATITISAGTDLTTGGNFTTNQGSNETITINHADTSTLSGTYGSTANGTKIDQITVDARGHVTAITTGATGTGSMSSFQLEDGDGTEVTINNGKEVKFVEGGGIDINWTDTSTGSDGDPYDLTFTHADTSSQASVNNSGNTVIQDVTLDTYGHVTGLTSKSLSIPAAANNATITLSAGTNLSGGGNFTTNQSSNETITFNLDANPSVTDLYVADQIIHTGDTNTYMQFHAADQWRVVTGGTERLEVNNSQMLVNNDIRVVDDDGIHIQTDTNAAGAKITMSDNSPSGGQVGTIEYRHSDSQSFGAGNAFKFFGTESSMSFHFAGNGLFTGNVATAYSDERLKDFDGKIESALDKLSQLNGYYYHANDTAVELGYDKEQRQVGVSAQEVEAVMPEVIAPAAIDPEYKTVHYDRLVPLLIEAIKELKAEIEELKRQ